MDFGFHHFVNRKPTSVCSSIESSEGLQTREGQAGAKASLIEFALGRKCGVLVFRVLIHFSGGRSSLTDGTLLERESIRFSVLEI